eukprot:9057509-Alexandrium_andersonii.AAC.1
MAFPVREAGLVRRRGGVELGRCGGACFRGTGARLARAVLKGSCLALEVRRLEASVGATRRGVEKPGTGGNGDG